MRCWFPGLSVVIILSVLGGSLRPPAAEERAKRGLGFDFRESSQPIRIKSDGLEWDYKGHVVTFRGNVIANQEDVTLYSDRMVIYYDETTSDVTQIVAEGAVRIVQLDRRATGEKAVFHNAEKKIVLTGRPVVRQGKNVVIGEK
ncbi:MAG: LptA/OstA family protein, partial [Thermodesulfobacteriota bacterium]